MAPLLDDNNMAALAELAPLFSACGCWQIEAAGTIARIAPDLAKSGKELSDVSQEANTKGTTAIQYTKDVAEVLQGFKDQAKTLTLEDSIAARRSLQS